MRPRIRHLGFAALLVGFAVALLFAQAPQRTSAVAVHVPPMAPQLSEVERLKLENLQLKSTLLAQQQQQVQTEYGALLQSIQREYPGYFWNPATQALVAIPKPTPTPPLKK